MRWARVSLLVLVGASAVVAFTGGIALAILRAVDANSAVLGTMLPIYQHLVLAFLATGVLAIAWGTLDRPAPAPAAEPKPEPAPAPPPAPAKIESVKPDLATTFQQMKTYIDLEMWELAMDKANSILEHHPGTREAEAVSRNHNELRWKAEPKFVARASQPVSASEEKTLQEKGLAAMLKHVRTYMELEMWELAKQKAVAVMKHFPDSKEAAEAVALYQQIEKKLPQPVAEKKA